LRKIAVNEDYLGRSLADDSILPWTAVFKRIDHKRSNLVPDRKLPTNFAFVKIAFKILCRENSVSHDRRTSIEIAALLVALVREGAHCEKELIDGVHQRWSPLRVH